MALPAISLNRHPLAAHWFEPRSMSSPAPPIRVNVQLKRNYRGQQQGSAQNWPNSFEFRRASVTYDLNAQVRITKRVALFVTGRNLTNEPTVMEWSSPATPDYAKVQRFIESGAQYAVGLKGTF